jgi:hypothetical protein
MISKNRNEAPVDCGGTLWFYCIICFSFIYSILGLTMYWCDYLNSSDQQVRMNCQWHGEWGTQINLEQKFNLNFISTIQLSFFLWAAGSPLSLPGEQRDSVLLILVRKPEDQISNKSSTSIRSPSLSLRIMLFGGGYITAPQRKGISSRNVCDNGDQCASIRRMIFPKFARTSRIWTSQQTQWIQEIYSAFLFLFICCIVEKTPRSSSTLPSVFLPDNMEPYPLNMKLHPSILLNKYKTYLPFAPAEVQTAVYLEETNRHLKYQRLNDLNVRQTYTGWIFQVCQWKI